MPVIWGIMNQFINLRTTNLRVIEDAAHAFGTKGIVLLEVLDIVCFSFDGIKNITCGEGGCISSDELLNKIET